MLHWKDFILPYVSRKAVTEIFQVVALLLSLLYVLDFFIVCEAISE